MVEGPVPPGAAAGAEKRLHERHDTFLPFQIEGRERPANDYIENLSITGAYVRTLEPLPIRTRLKITIFSPKTRRPFTFDGEVMRVIEPEQSPSEGLPPGMGVAFLDLGGGDPRPKAVEILNEAHALAQRTPPRAEEKTNPPLDPKMLESLAELDKALQAARTQNYYQLLGVDPAAATPQVVKKCYHRRSKEFHPDRFHRVRTKEIDAKVEELYGLLTKAYETLRDTAKREVYDASHGIQATVEFRRAAARARVEEALAHLRRNRLFGATMGLKVALSLDPGNPEIQRKLEELERRRKFFVT